MCGKVCLKTPFFGDLLALGPMFCAGWTLIVRGLFHLPAGGGTRKLAFVLVSLRTRQGYQVLQ